MDDREQSVQHFLDLIKRSQRGKFKVYIGMIAGVGKSYRMLQEAHELLENGVDVKIGYIETHGRVGTEGMLQGLPVIPRRKIFYKGKELEEMDLDALNADTIKGYRVLFEQLHEGHPWNKLLKDEFLIKLKAAAKNKRGTVSPTVAGILMFGDADRITDVFPDYFLDYREECDDKRVRWLYRTHSNEGDWSGNLFDFFYKVTTRIDDDVAVPFMNRRNGVRVDRVDVHDALSEAVANALVHANYYGKRGIVIIKHGKQISISNPGTIRITKEEFYAGGNSDPRNPNLLKIFGFVNVGERAGSGVDKIMTAWEEQYWTKPRYEISIKAERITLYLEVGQVVYIPGAADLNVVREPEYYSGLVSDREQRLLDYLTQYGKISMGKATEVCGYKTKSATRKLIDKMIKNEILERTGSGPATVYILKR